MELDASDIIKLVKEYNNKYMRDYRKKNRERNLEYRKEYRQKNLEKLKQQDKDYYNRKKLKSKFEVMKNEILTGNDSKTLLIEFLQLLELLKENDLIELDDYKNAKEYCKTLLNNALSD